MPKKPDINRLIQLHRLLLDFQAIERIAHVPGKFEQENDTEHSYNLALSAWYLAEYFPELNKDKVIRFALVHDLVEIHAGDTYIYADQTVIDTKEERERAALSTLEKDWPDFPDMLTEIKAYETKDSAEAKFVYALDKLMPIMLIFIGEGYSWQKERVTLEQLHSNKQPKVASSPEIKPCYDQLYELLLQHRHYFSKSAPQALRFGK
ncbi:MAG TPA: HD domain-containing protein [Candidatus Acidoferrum sp.]|nr:HD domain-containing protein [Candidatus Acidoferrum sp.]